MKLLSRSMTVHSIEEVEGGRMITFTPTFRHQSVEQQFYTLGWRHIDPEVKNVSVGQVYNVTFELDPE